MVADKKIEEMTDKELYNELERVEAEKGNVGYDLELRR